MASVLEQLGFKVTDITDDGVVRLGDGMELHAQVDPDEYLDDPHLSRVKHTDRGLDSPAFSLDSDDYSESFDGGDSSGAFSARKTISKLGKSKRAIGQLKGLDPIDDGY